MEQMEYITVAILAKQKAHVLPLYLEQIEKQTYPASKIKLYIRTNNNKDNTKEILEEWVEKVKDRYSEIYLNTEDLPYNVQDYRAHEWNNLRLRVIGHLRQESIIWARERGTHYFVADCDNFVIPETIEELVKTNLPVVAPLLRNVDKDNEFYSNFHYAVDDAGYLAPSDHYFHVLYRSVRGLIEVPVVHCTYFIQKDYVQHIVYDDGSGRFEYVIFSDTLRKLGIPQYMDNRLNYGKLTFAETEEEFVAQNVTM